MKILIGCLLSVIFLALSAIHFYWGAGGKTGHAASIPTKADGTRVINPGKVACFVVASGLLIFSVFVMIKTGIVSINLPGWLVDDGIWAIAVLFLLRAIGDFNYIGFFKKLTTTGFGRMDTMYYSPLCLVIAALNIALNIIN